LTPELTKSQLDCRELATNDSRKLSRRTGSDMEKQDALVRDADGALSLIKKCYGFNNVVPPSPP